jgi:hypothetical protein
MFTMFFKILTIIASIVSGLTIQGSWGLVKKHSLPKSRSQTKGVQVIPAPLALHSHLPPPPRLGCGQVAGRATPATPATSATFTPLTTDLRQGPASGRACLATPATLAALRRKSQTGIMKK